MKTKTLAAAFLLLTALLGAAPPVTFSRGGRAGGFIGLADNWSGFPDTVEIEELPAGLRFTFRTGVEKGNYRVSRAKHDSPALLGGESIELQLVPDPASGVYFHIGFTPEGLVYSARKRDTAWEAKGMKLDVREWGKAVVDLPYAALGVSVPSPGSVWKVNFCRTRSVGGETRHASWGGGSSFHDVNKYGLLKFGHPDEPQVLPGVQTVLDARARVFEAPPGYSLELLEEGTPWPGQVNRAGEWFFAAPKGFEVPLKSDRLRTFRLKDATGRILWERSARSGFDNRRYLELDRFAYTPQEKVFVWRTLLPGAKEFFLSGPRNVKWRSAAASGRHLLPDLPGRYVLTVSNGQAKVSRVMQVLKQPPRPLGCAGTWEKRGSFFFCGDRMRFLFGASPSRVCALQYGNVFDLAVAPAGTLPGALELYAMKGKRLRRAPDGTGYVFPCDEPELLRRCAAFAAGMKGKPLRISRLAYEAQMKFFLTEKGELVSKTPELMYYLMYRELKKGAPDQLFSLQIDRQEATERFAPACDVLEIAVRGSYLPDPLPGIAGKFRELRAALPDKVLIQWLGVTVPDISRRNGEELRAELFLAFLNGSAGAILHLGHGLLPAERSRIWSVISTTGTELDELMAEFHTHPAIPVKEPAGFQAALRDCGDYHLLVVVNCLYKNARLKLQLPGNRLFNASFTPCEARVFRLKK